MAVGFSEFPLEVAKCQFFKPSNIMVEGTPSRWDNRDKLSPVLPFVVIGCARDHPNNVA
jgi:hypothetical protein